MHSHIKHIISTCGAIICYENTPIEDQIKVLRINVNRNKVLPEVILELLCDEAWAVPDMKNSPATIRFFSDAEWNSPSSAGGVVCDTEGVSERVPQLPVLVWLKPVKITIRLDKKASVRESLCIKCESAECSQHPDSTPVWWPQSAAPTPPSPREVTLQSRASRKLQLHTDTEGFCSGSGAALWTFATDVKICHSEEGGPASGDNVFTSSTMNSL